MGGGGGGATSWLCSLNMEGWVVGGGRRGRYVARD